jgi:uncharacterized membrane protein
MWFVHLPANETFSELYVLGSTHVAEDYPFNVSGGQTYSVFLGITNHMGGAMYYVLNVTIRNESDALPSTILGAESPLPSFCRYRVFLANNETWEEKLNFSLADVSVGLNASRIGTVSFNGVASQVNKTIAWDENRRGFYFQVLAELSTYDHASLKPVYSNRFVGLWMNVTAAS